ncbi:MAG: class I SAM-dependent methyltransferase [Chlamydiia bacterium]|nr:class I SAM-dependent methyltransferase [Chlamydiia bacterium]
MFLKFAHQIWENQLPSGGVAIDATCGNGHDAAFLATLDLSHLYVCDIQKEALSRTQERLGENEKILYYLGCHSCFPFVDQPVDLIVYNLGYLPGGDKSLTTKTETTLRSVEKGLSLLSLRGLISCMIYPGHSEGSREGEALLNFTSTLSPKKFEVSHHQALNRSRAPSLLLIKKIS